MPGGDSNRVAGLVGSRRGSIVELVLMVAVAVSLALAVQAWAVKPFQIPSESMEPTLTPGQRVLVDRFSGRFKDGPEVGDVVVFHPPLNAVPAEQDSKSPLPRCPAGAARRDGQPCPEPGGARASAYFIKRVVAGPGDRIRIVDGTPVVNGEALGAAWETVPCAGGSGCDFTRAIVVPDDHYFVMGDNRPGSDDSRFWGPVPSDWIIGRAFASYWPFDRLGSL